MGALTPVLDFARTALSQPATRASQAGSAPTGVWMTGWSAMSSGMSASSSPTGWARSKPNACFARSGPKRNPSQISRSRFFSRQKRISRGFLPSTITSTASGSRNPVR